jgi:hypothetical protein
MVPLGTQDDCHPFTFSALAPRPGYTGQGEAERFCPIVTLSLGKVKSRAERRILRDLCDTPKGACSYCDREKENTTWRPRPRILDRLA